MGQIKEAVRIMCHGRPAVDPEHAVTNAYCYESAFRGIEPVGGILSISSPEIEDSFRVAHDIQQVARYGLHSARCYRDPGYRQKSHAYVYGDPPRRYSAYEPELPVLFRRPVERG